MKTYQMQSPTCPACLKPFSKEEGKKLAAWQHPSSYRCPHCGVDVVQATSKTPTPSWPFLLFSVLIALPGSRHTVHFIQSLQLTDPTESIVNALLDATPWIVCVFYIHWATSKFREFHWQLKEPSATN